MSTTLCEGDRVQVSRFACGRCKAEGPCFQITGIGPKSGDYVIVHRLDALPVCRAIMKDLGVTSVSYEEPAKNPVDEGGFCRICGLPIGAHAGHCS
jgi:hypothetical protein